MATRQYIGARYVPLFIGEWSANTAYEPLSIVTDGNGNSYTSKKRVPVGTPLSNAAYWVETGNFNQQVESYRRLSFNAGKAFENVSDMKLFPYFEDGMVATTLGFHAAGDSGAASYVISSSGTADDMTVIRCGSKYAHLVVGNHVTPQMFGASSDADSLSNFAAMFASGATVFEVAGNFTLSNGVNIPDWCEVDFQNASFEMAPTAAYCIKVGNEEYTTGLQPSYIVHGNALFKGGSGNNTLGLVLTTSRQARISGLRFRDLGNYGIYMAPNNGDVDNFDISSVICYATKGVMLANGTRSITDGVFRNCIFTNTGETPTFNIVANKQSVFGVSCRDSFISNTSTGCIGGLVYVDGSNGSVYDIDITNNSYETRRDFVNFPLFYIKGVRTIDLDGFGSIASLGFKFEDCDGVKVNKCYIPFSNTGTSMQTLVNTVNSSNVDFTVSSLQKALFVQDNLDGGSYTAAYKSILPKMITSSDSCLVRYNGYFVNSDKLADLTYTAYQHCTVNGKDVTFETVSISGEGSSIEFTYEGDTNSKYLFITIRADEDKLVNFNIPAKGNIVCRTNTMFAIPMPSASQLTFYLISASDEGTVHNLHIYAGTEGFAI